MTNAPQTIAELAAAVVPDTVQTPALDLVDEALMWAHTTPDARLIVTMPPQEGKTTRIAFLGTLWALRRDPALRVGIVSYSSGLSHSIARRIAEHAPRPLWSATGVGAPVRGPLDAIVVDDPIADGAQVSSAAHRDRMWRWWQNEGLTRLSPGASAIIGMSRWHKDDLAGRLLTQGSERWRVVNIPAQADHDPAKGGSDPLGREPGEWLASAHLRSPGEWEQIRVQAGTRIFKSLYQGSPQDTA